MSTKLRLENPGDEDEIHRLTAAAFSGLPYSDGREPVIVDRMRQSGDLMLSLVAEQNDALVGHVAFSPVVIDGEHNWVGLGPAAVDPACQRCGIGTALINKGLIWLRGAGARGCVLVGDPGYYRRFGFESDGLLSFGNLDRKFVQRVVFEGPAPQGALRYVPAFDPE